MKGGQELLREWQARAEAAEAERDDINSRLDDAHAFAQRVAGRSAKHWGRNVWHVVLDEAVRLEARVAVLETALGQAVGALDAAIMDHRQLVAADWPRIGATTEHARETKRSRALSTTPTPDPLAERKQDERATEKRWRATYTDKPPRVAADVADDLQDARALLRRCESLLNLAAQSRDIEAEGALKADIRRALGRTP